ncbi:MAG: TonB-dependent receptor [Ginsengibacter sp.]
MKNTILSVLFLGVSYLAIAQDSTVTKLSDTLMLENIEITSIRAADKAPFAKTNLDKTQISKLNMGQDLPFILNQTPNIIVNSDAGNGVGYTGMRIRGSDAARINVTLNGIPYNDAESQGTFFVDMPDISSSVSSIQIQRGVGTSSNGAGAFGASINLSTNEVNEKAYVELSNAYGSFNTLKTTVKTGTGLLGNHFIVDGRFSKIASDGFIDRATSNLQSFYLSGVYIDDKSSLRFNVIGGKEKTYQAWGGVPESYLETNRTYNPSGTEKPGEPYENETDNYSQTHFQLFYNRKIKNAFSLNAALYLSRGKGYYEEYRASQKYKNYGISDLITGTDTLKKTDLIRQKWLDNYLYGTILSFQYKKNKTQLTLGGGWNQYDGGHYGKVKWAKSGGFPVDYTYYDNPAQKNDLNIYAKVMQTLGKGFTGFLDLQGRFLQFEINGFKDNPSINVGKDYSFFNPKAGVSFNKNNYQAFVSFSVAAHEPNRDDFEAGIQQLPKPETLYDWELGLEKKETNFNYGVVIYYMLYRNQLVNTGKINDVGAYTRTNTPNSYRAGVELEGSVVAKKWMNVSGNIAFSKNKIEKFTEYIDDYDDANGKQKENNYSNTDISFSPAVVGAATLTLLPIKNAEIDFQSKYVSKQFLDNTSDDEKIIPSYFTQNVRLAYSLQAKNIKQLTFILQLNNVFNKKYVANGYTYNYVSEGKLAVENYYFPMAGINFMVGVNIKL